MGILLDFIDKFTSAPKLDPKGETELYTFKTVADPFVGKLSYFKVLQGTLKAGDTLHNPRKDTDEKFARIFTVKGKAQTEVKELVAVLQNLLPLQRATRSARQMLLFRPLNIPFRT